MFDNCLVKQTIIKSKLWLQFSFNSIREKTENFYDETLQDGSEDLNDASLSCAYGMHLGIFLSPRSSCSNAYVIYESWNQSIVP